jgi:hypothetical protein
MILAPLTGDPSSTEETLREEMGDRGREYRPDGDGRSPHTR